MYVIVLVTVNIFHWVCYKLDLFIWLVPGLVLWSGYKFGSFIELVTVWVDHWDGHSLF